MAFNRRQLAVLALAASGALAVTARASPADEAAITKQLEAFRSAQVAADAKAFDALCTGDLSYSHSDGRVEDKAQFIAGATAGRSKFISLAYKEPKIRVTGDVATVRFNWQAEQEAVADGKRTPTNLHILMTWVKQGGEWKLLSRSSTRL